MNAMHVGSGWTNVHCVDRARMAQATNPRKESDMSKLSVAELIGETPEMLKLCGRILILESERESMTAKQYRTHLRSLRHHMRLMQSMTGVEL